MIEYSDYSEYSILFFIMYVFILVNRAKPIFCEIDRFQNVISSVW